MTNPEDRQPGRAPSVALGRLPATSRTGKRVVGVSLKMYFDPAKTLTWAKEVAELARQHPATQDAGVLLFVLPSFLSLVSVVEAVRTSPVAVGAQDLCWEDRGPFTGAVSGLDLRQVGCSMVEVGHMERRRIFGENDATVRAKVAAAVRNDLRPIICVGERVPGSSTQAARDSIAQLEAALRGLDRLGRTVELVIAYEPEWAIGAESPATSDHVSRVIAALRQWLNSRPWLAASLIYGGGAGPGMLADLNGAVDGLFLGRYAHDPRALSSVLDEVLAIR